MEPLAQEWLDLDDTEQKVKKQLSTLRKRKKDLLNQLLEYMAQQNSQELFLSHAKVIQETKQMPVSMTQKVMIDTLTQHTNLSPEKAQTLIELLYKHRPTKETKKVRVVKRTLEKNEDREIVSLEV